MSTSVPLAALPQERRARARRGACLADAHGSWDNTAFAAAVERAAACLATLGVGPGDVVATVLPDRVAGIVTLFAAWRIGAAVAPIDPDLGGTEAGWQLRDVGASVVVTDRARSSRVGQGTWRTVNVDHLGEVPGAAPPPVVVAEDEPALIVHTAGSAGRPQKVVLDHARLAAATALLVEAFAITEADRSLVTAPLFHSNALVLSVLAPLAVGAGVTLATESSTGVAAPARRGDPDTFWSDVARCRATFVLAVPTLFSLLLATPGGEDQASTLRFAACGFAPMPPGLADAWRRRFEVPLVEGYGLTETAGFCAAQPLEGPRIAGTVGRPLPGVEARVVDSAGAPVPPGGRGEIQIRGPIAGDGWLRTGDIGTLAADGSLRLLNRATDLILTAGEPVAPQEVENVLHRHPAIADAAVVGRHDAVLGEVAVAVVVLKPGAELDRDGLAVYCRQRLQPVQVPVDLRIVEALPRNSLGKVSKGTVRCLVEEQPDDCCADEVATIRPSAITAGC